MKALRWIKQQVINFTVGVIVIALIIVATGVSVLIGQWLIKDTVFEKAGLLGLAVLGGLILAVIIPIGKRSVDRFTLWRGRR